MTDFKDQMIEAVERGECSDDRAYDYVREAMSDGADRVRDSQMIDRFDWNSRDGVTFDAGRKDEAC